jgi:cell wall-associated NlpC family hydrolase
VSWQRGAQLLVMSRLRALAAAALAALVVISIQPPAPAAAASPADRVIAIAVAERGSPWAYGATGPSAFDCSGLVTYAFRRARQLDAIGNGRYRSGRSLLHWARSHHLTTSHGRRGDIAVWGNGSHVGIYLGRGLVVSTLVSGVRVTRVHALTTRFTTFISTGLSGSGPASARTATATAPAKPKVIARRTVAVASLNLRSAPRLSARVTRVLDRGTRVGVVRSATDATGRTWYRVVVGSRVGWVAGWLTRPAR